MKDEFYIGWERKAPPGTSRSVRRFVVLLLMLALLAAVSLALAQRTIGTAAFEWGDLKKFTGVLELEPYPHLLVARPGRVDGRGDFSSYYLVAPFKFGLDRQKLFPLGGRMVSLQGTLLYREGQTMVEAVPDSIKASAESAPSQRAEPSFSLGRQTLTGEIVDSKCFLGAMNPGRLAPHRACAIRCISGGIPPVLLVRRNDGTAIYFLLVSAAGKPVNRQVLDFVAEPVQITGEVERQGGLLILRADPAEYLRL